MEYECPRPSRNRGHLLSLLSLHFSGRVVVHANLMEMFARLKKKDIYRNRL
jgi:hypothetical protein